MTKRNKASFTDVIELKFTIPEDELHPVTGDVLPHKVIITHKKHNPETGERSFYNQASLGEMHPDRKAAFLISVMSTVLMMIRVQSEGKTLKLKYIGAMESLMTRLLKLALK